MREKDIEQLAAQIARNAANCDVFYFQNMVGVDGLSRNAVCRAANRHLRRIAPGLRARSLKSGIIVKPYSMA